MLETSQGRARLLRYYDGYLEIARTHGAGFVVETPTWRANPDWAAQLGYSALTTVVSGCVGPRGDGYDPGEAMSVAEAQRYHSAQLGAFAASSADQVTAITMTNAVEAIGLLRAASAAGIPSVVSFTVETDGRLPTGQPLHQAIEQVDDETGGAAAYFMVNCAHPTHFRSALDHDGVWRQRLLGLRANASSLSHAELDEGIPDELAGEHAALRGRLPAVRVLGGCCGTDARHVAAIVSAWRAH